MMKLSKLSCATALGLGVALLGQHAAAQQASSEAALEKITVTGSTIPRTEAETALPIEIITKADIEKSGKQTLADVVNSITSNNNGTVPIAFGAGFAHGSAGVALRGLSVNSTLVLVNGRRMASYGLTDDGQRSFVDLNSIPLDAVEQIQILKDGASATYGSDAIAGVVNIIMSKNYVGGTASYTLGQSGQNDGSEYRATVKYGFGDIATDKYNFFVNVEVGHQAQIMGDQRSGRIGSMNLTNLGQGDQRAGGLGNLPWGGSVGDGNSITPSSLPGTVINTTLSGQGNGTGGIYQLPGCNPANLDANGLCRWEWSHYIGIQPDVTRKNIFGRLTADLGGGTEGFFEFGVFAANTFSQYLPGGVRATVYDVATQQVIVQSINLPVGSPYNPFNSPSRLYVGWGPGRDDYDKSQQQRYVAGIKGSRGGWDWDADIGLTHSSLDSSLTGYLLYTPTKAALTSGQLLPGILPCPICSPATGTASLGAISPTLQTNGSSDNDFLDLHASHDAIPLPGGMSQFSIGAEFRHEKLDSPAVPGTENAEVIGLGFAQSKDSRNVSAVYAEFFMPILKNFNATLAARDDHYSTYGNSFAPKLGLEFSPVQALKLRTTASTGFRAPSASEAGKDSASAGYANCPTGITCSGGQIGVVSVGNPFLKPEKSTNYDFGFVFEPVRSFNMTYDVYKITRRNEIIQADPVVVLADPTAYPAAVISTDTNGNVLAVSSPYINAASTKTSGWDLDVVHKLDLGANGKLTTHLNVDHIMSFVRDFGGGVVLQYAGFHGPNVMSSDGGMPATRASLTLDWAYGAFDTTLTGNYRAHMNNQDNGSQDCTAVTNYAGTLQGPCYTPSFTTFDLSGHYQVNKSWEVYGSVRNILDRVAPYDPVTYGYIPGNANITYDLAGFIGRFFNVGVRYTLPK